jgi:hypothetical protein
LNLPPSGHKPKSCNFSSLIRLASDDEQHDHQAPQRQQCVTDGVDYLQLAADLELEIERMLAKDRINPAP